MSSNSIPLKKTVFVGLSGGVDSSVTARRLIKQGYAVHGVFIKTWQPDFLVCNWEAERLDAMRVAAELGIPFYTCDATESYKHAVAEYMIKEYTAGRTPNPDVMCNKYVKFGTFLEYARAQGASHIATGHYAQVQEHEGMFHLYRGADPDKDQSYFLWTLTQEQLGHTLFPVGDSLKSKVREEADTAELSTSQKTDSQGICFLGQIDMKEFLSHYIENKPGDVIDEKGTSIGIHDGALFYTIGQRHGFTVGVAGSESVPYYVVDKDVVANTITVATEPKYTEGESLILGSVNCIQGFLPQTCMAQFRYRQKPFPVSCEVTQDGHVMLTVQDPHIERPSLGQSCVFYNNTECLGGGIINERICKL